jgi:hypothetical protein
VKDENPRAETFSCQVYPSANKRVDAKARVVCKQVNSSAEYYWMRPDWVILPMNLLLKVVWHIAFVI